MGQPPIVPGPEPQPEPEPTATPPPQPQVRYVPSWQPTSESKVASNTIVVLVVLFSVFIGLPALCCLGWLLLGGIGSVFG